MRGKGYFKGWYFKCCADGKTIAFIPAYHHDGRAKTASLQIITDNEVSNIPFEPPEYTEKPLFIRLGDCCFSEKGIALNYRSDRLKLSGLLNFDRLSPVSYDIMGPFAMVPFMQCRHSVYSMRHTINGKITINGDRFNFDSGVGYIEGDSGRSFPKRYIWTQCCFEESSLMLSVADIPISGLSFTGVIGAVLISGKEYRIATYLGARVKSIDNNTVTVRQGAFELTAKLLEKNPHTLFAPINGDMRRKIHESASCRAYYRFSHNNKPLCEFTSDAASFEFEYSL
ncbi:MAG: tocopherol cyclase family protein [Acutalibacteraceae bacterium]